MGEILISRLVVLLISLAAWLTPAAFAQDCSDPVSFERVFEHDVPGGRYFMGEDAEISSRFRDGSAIAADFKTIEPHRTKEFGSGVAFWFCDAREQRAIRVAFGDMEGEDTLRMAVIKFFDLKSPKGKSEVVLRQSLSLPKTRLGRVGFRKEAKGRLTIEVDDQTLSIDPGFEMHNVLVQVYCANGWARFVDGDLIS